MAAFLGGYIPTPTYTSGQGDFGVALLVIGAFLLISIAITAALVYFNPPKAQPKEQPKTTQKPSGEMLKAA